MWGAYASFIESNQEKETNKPVITLCRIKLSGLTFMGLSLKDFQSDRDLHL